MTSYTPQARGTIQLDGADNKRLPEVNFFPDLSAPALSPQVFDVTVTGRSPTDTAPTAASGSSTDEERRAEVALAQEFGVSTALFRRVKAIVSETIRHEDGLSLNVERLVDPEIGRAVQLVFEVRGAASASEVTRIWEAINSRIESLAHSLNDSDLRSLVDDIGVHVHRA